MISPPSWPPPKPDWLPEEVYTNIVEDAATPLDIRVELLQRVANAGNIPAARAAFTKYLDSVAIPNSEASLDTDASLGHFFYSTGFFKHVVEMIGSGDESIIAAEFDILRDPAKPRRERRKVLQRLTRALRGKAIRPGSTIWLYEIEDDSRPTVSPPDVLAHLDPCLPWRLALPRVSTGSEYVHFEVSAGGTTGNCRTPNCKDAGFDTSHLEARRGHRPSPCTAIDVRIRTRLERICLYTLRPLMQQSSHSGSVLPHEGPH